MQFVATIYSQKAFDYSEDYDQLSSNLRSNSSMHKQTYGLPKNFKNLKKKKKPLIFHFIFLN